MNETTHSPNDFAAAFESAFARFQTHFEAACDRKSDWSARVVAATRAALDFAAADPIDANTLTNGALAAGPDGFARFERLITYVAEPLGAGRELHPEGSRLPTLTERALVSGLVMWIAQRIDQGRAAELPGSLAEATQFVLTPYLGSAEARRVALSQS